MSNFKDRLEALDEPADGEPAGIPCNRCGDATSGRVCSTCQRCKW